MPELPEVEVIRISIESHLVGRCINQTNTRNVNQRWPIPHNLNHTLSGLKIRRVMRRGKYLLLDCTKGTLILHLGMSGSLRLLTTQVLPQKHDHFDLILNSGQVLRLRDPRRFGAVLWETGDVMHHRLLAQLGPEPLTKKFNGKFLYEKTRSRRISIKEILMSSKVVAGIGNIYANEALFHASINPKITASKLSIKKCNTLARTIKKTLRLAIKAGGSSLRDFVNSDNSPGYYQLQCRVYNRTGQACQKCGTGIKKIRQGQRSSFYCPNCQK